MILQEMFRPVNAIPKYTDEQKKAMDAARESEDFVLPQLQKPEPGFFDGIGEAAWKGPVAGALKTASAFDTLLSSTGMARSALQHYQNETGNFFDDLDKRQIEVENQLDKDARQVRAMAKKDFGVNPETMGTAAQIVYGIGETISKAIGYSLLGGQAGGSLMFGADLGVNRAQELMDEGVDKETAINAGLVTFGTAAFGMRLPATFGKSRIASATIGAAVNTGLSVAELQGVNWVLQSQNYNELSKKYELNFVDLATSAIFGGVMGAAFFRPGMTPKQTTQVQIRDDFSKQLKEVHPEFSDEQINAQAEIHAVGVMAMAERAGVDASEIAPTIVNVENIQGGELLQTAYHGTPHIFDKFNLKAIGTGEGAQAHGWGLYFAKNKAIAARYREYLTSKNTTPRLLYKGEPIENLPENVQSLLQTLTKNLGLSRDIKAEYDNLVYHFDDRFKTGDYVARIFEKYIDLIDKTPKLSITAFVKAVDKDDKYRIKYSVDAARNLAAQENRRATIQDVRKVLYEKFETSDNYRKEHKASLDALRAVDPEDLSIDTTSDKGRLFEVDIPEDTVLLDEQKYMGSSRDTELRSKIEWIIQEWDNKHPGNPLSLPESPNGREIYQAISDALGGPKEASLYLNRYGIKGITYDGLRDGRCYVVFDDEAIKVLDFYQRSQNVNPVATITGDEFGSADIDIKELRANAKNWYDLNLRGKTVVNNQTGKEIVFANSNKAIATSANPEKLKAFAALESVLRDGNMREMEGVKKPKGANILGYYWVTANVDIGGKIVEVGATVRQQTDGRFYYNHNVLKDETPNSTPTLRHNAGGEVEGSEKLHQSNLLTSDDTFNIYIGQENQPIKGSFNPALNEIKLTPNADMSTFSHEMGHWYLTNLFELSGKKGVDPTLVEDVNTLLKEFGVNSVEDWNALGIEGQRKAQEQFASWVEIYLSSGKAPKPSLTRLFERMAQWIVDVYRELGGTKKAVSERFEGEFQTKLPETSPEVQKVLDRLFAKNREIRKARKVDAEQVAAARMVQSERTNKDRLKEIVAMPEGVSKTKVLQDQEKALTAQLKAVRDMLDGRSVDVSKELKDVNINEQVINQGKHDFGRQVLVGDNQRAVILQNRDRATDASINQMLNIAGNPQYGMVSVSRGYNGAPIVSFGQLPEQRFMGNQDFITENNGNEIPFQYAVVEGDSVETSNSILGDKNPNYGNPDVVSAVVGNGRMTALKEAYVRNTAGTYRQKLTADSQHGIDPAVIAEMKNPILVRFISPDDVTTGLISRSNADQVLARNDVEVAFEDAPKIRANIKNYEFDENGEPTRDTLLQFAQDIDDVNAQGHLISGGEPSKEAIRRLRNAVFYEAYQTPALSQMYSIETDTGIARILNALSALAPKVVRLRETAKSLDFSSELVNAVNEIIKARTESADGKVILGQGGLFGGDVSEPFIQLLSENSNSAKAILRVLSPLADWAESASQIKEGGLFGDDIVPSADIGDLMVQMRNIQNELRAEKGLEALPEIDVEAVRASAAQLMDEAAEGLENINTALNEIDAQVAPKVDEVDTPEQDLRGLSRSVLDENTSEAARAELQNFDDPDQVFKFIDDDGNEMSGTLQELLEQGQKAVDDAEIEADAYGRATECILRNEGI